MSILKRALAAVATLVLSGSLAVATATPADADWYEDGVFSLPYSDELWRVDSASDAFWPLSYAEWAALGFPAPKPSQTSFVKYPWSPTVYAVTFFGDERQEWLWATLTFEQWSRAGSPPARIAGWIAGSYYYQWGTSAEVFVQGQDDVIHKLTFAEWEVSGFMPPEQRWNEGFVQRSGNPTIFWMPDLSVPQMTPITYDEWRRQDSPTPKLVKW
ncbi:hypothetical protein L1785_05270 [Antribacter sp. KLBMP9083]|uniref:Secreted protein n=1 Tax=Antribacter soli TaxID=2910976 RepID=A0AA41QBV9_9MICO|nr:hypothetical protein [Antribacter soli]MCF4120383.1 hypothetical protein [Antribacter soli]